MKTIFCYLLAIALSLGLISCGEVNISERIEAFPLPDIKGISLGNFNGDQTTVSEAAPPILIRKLGQIIDTYQPQVAILKPRADQVLESTNVTVQLKVTDYPLFKDENLAMGPHLHLILDNEPYQAIYNVAEPIVLENLEPGTHTLRVFAARPWHESFKNKGAYAETTFHILTKTQANNPAPQLPLLTYSRPNGTYGAEPIMLDFYLSHLPGKDLVKNSAVAGLPDWRVKATVNGESFILDQWQPVYLSGFKEGNNWIQLELLDEQGNSIENVFNNTVRLITYDPEVDDSLARIVTEKIALQNAIAIIDPNYKVPVEETLQEVTVEVEEEDVTTESEISQEEILPSESKVIDEEDILEEKSKVIEEEVNLKTEIVTETPQITEEQIVEPEITQEDAIPANNLELSEEKVEPEIEIIPETSDVNSGQIVEKQTNKQVKLAPDNAAIIEEEVSAETRIITENPTITPEQVVKEPTNKQDNISVDNSELVEEEVDKQPEQAINLSEETADFDLAIAKEIPQLTESAIGQSLALGDRDRIIMIAEQEVIEPKVANSLPEKATTLENSSASETDTDQGTDLVSISKEPFNVTVNLDQWVGDYLRIFRDKIVELAKLFFN